jgi:hypothetical protein
MNNEFKKSNNGQYTVYTLESATSGGTSAGGIASVTMPMGGVRRRGDNLIAQEEKKEAPKPRNFVAKNAKMGGAGQHKDKKKAEKQGDVKHKKPFAESERTMSRAAKGNEKYGKDGMKALAKAGREGASEKKLDAIRDKHDNYNEDSDPCWKDYKQIGMKKKDGKQVPNCVPKEGVIEDDSALQAFLSKGGKVQQLPYKKPRKADKTDYGSKHIGGSGDKMKASRTGTAAKTQGNKVAGMAEDHEIQMASSELQSIAKNAVNLLSLVRKYSENDGLEAWQQSKITKAADYLNSVLQSVSGEQTKLEGYGSNRGYQQGFASPTAPSLGQRHRDRDSGDDEPQGMFTVVINGRPWKEFTSNKAFQVAKTIATKHPDKQVQVKWPSGQLNTIKEEVEDRTSYQVAKILSNKGIKYNPAHENDLINAIGMVLVKELNMSPKQARHLISYDEDFLSDTMGELRSMENVGGDAYMESLALKLAEKIPANAPTEVWVQDFQKADPNKYHQFKNKTPAKKAQMAVAASYAAKNPSKKK